MSQVLCGLVALGTIIYEQIEAPRLQTFVEAAGFWRCCLSLALVASHILSGLTGHHSGSGSWWTVMLLWLITLPRALIPWDPRGAICTVYWEWERIYRFPLPWASGRVCVFQCGRLVNKSGNNLQCSDFIWRMLILVVAVWLVSRKHTFRLKSLGWSIACFGKRWKACFKIQLNQTGICILLGWGLW